MVSLASYEGLKLTYLEISSIKHSDDQRLSADVALSRRRLTAPIAHCPPPPRTPMDPVRAAIIDIEIYIPTFTC